ncbi:23S rRNA accumulation protein YceD [Pseudidiomarina aestuarii]|uniref:Large ribosomal RNA subunit accumulation protein YceD n=1 Tax=Pseudidiomarina aestuarii TaxID=624146 RepID=A0A7Z6ZTS0_9GAMM|nr:23S rRNA accumulation protein YceD [Pseudidiomarina aestuarii]RUO41141.1 23S rRNA accumulation protein YceD [Pseudidiomarina aestuarii]
MQKVRIPISVDPVKSAGKQLSYQGLVPGNMLARLQEMLVEPCPDVDVELQFDIDPQQLKYIQGSATVDVVAACERCGEPMALTLETSFIYAPVTKRQAADDMPEDYEPIELDELNEVNLHRIVEDELILAMPAFVKHDEQACQIDSKAMQWGEIDETLSEQENPFAVLQALKRK